jgi:hypothetical protein
VERSEEESGKEEEIRMDCWLCREFPEDFFVKQHVRHLKRAGGSIKDDALTFRRATMLVAMKSSAFS